MPDPRRLKVGDRVRFVSLPDEWEQPGYQVHEESREFMRALIARARPSRVHGLDEHGFPWIAARLRCEDGTLEYHDWLIMETTGWRLVRRRKG